MGCGMNLVKFTLFIFNLVCAVSCLFSNQSNHQSLNDSSNDIG